MRVILVHGFNSSPEENFHPWLKKELQDVGFEVVAPKLPLQKDTELNLPFIMEEMKKQVGYIKGDDIFLGHSLGGLIVLQYLEVVEMKETPRAVLLIATPWKVSRPELRRLFMADLDAEVLMWKARDFFVVHSADDALVPVEHGRKLAESLKAKFIQTQTDDHYMGSAYPSLLSLILTIKETPVEYQPGKGLGDDFEKINLSDRLKQQEEDSQDVEKLI